MDIFLNEWKEKIKKNQKKQQQEQVLLLNNCLKIDWNKCPYDILVMIMNYRCEIDGTKYRWVRNRLSGKKLFDLDF